MSKITISGFTCQPRPDEKHLPGVGTPSPGGAFSLPCLYSNNATETLPHESEYSLISALQNLLSSYHKRQAETLHLNTKRLIEITPGGIDHVGFMTLTFVDNVTDAKEAYKRFTSLNNHFLAPSPDFLEWINVKEPQKRGAWHFHLLIGLEENIRSGFNFDEYLYYQNQIKPYMNAAEKRRLNRLACASANPALRTLWSKLRMAMPKYRFGRSEMLPIRTNDEGIARYIGKYISKGILGRSDAQKGIRLVSYSKGWAKNSVQFQWLTPGSQEWRKKLELFAAIHGCSSMYDLTDKLGPNWAYKYQDDIFSLPGPAEVTRYDSLIAKYQFLAKEHLTTERFMKRIEKWKQFRKQKYYQNIYNKMPKYLMEENENENG